MTINDDVIQQQQKLILAPIWACPIIMYAEQYSIAQRIRIIWLPLSLDRWPIVWEVDWLALVRGDKNWRQEAAQGEGIRLCTKENQVEFYKILISCLTEKNKINQSSKLNHRKSIRNAGEPGWHKNKIFLPATHLYLKSIDTLFLSRGRSRNPLNGCVGLLANRLKKIKQFSISIMIIHCRFIMNMHSNVYSALRNISINFPSRALGNLSTKHPISKTFITKK